MEPYQIINKIFSRFRGLPGKLARLNGKCEELYSSHGREPRTRNPLQSGNLSAVDHYMKYCRQFQAASGSTAGLELADMVHAALVAEFTEGEEITLAELHRESTEALQSTIENKPAREQTQQHLEAIGVHARRIKDLARKDSQLRQDARKMVSTYRGVKTNGRK